MPKSERKRERFIELLKPLQATIEAYCRRSMPRSNDAEDVIQAAVMKAYRDFDQYSEGTNFRAWIFKYVNLEILTSRRRAARQSHNVIAFDSDRLTEVDHTVELPSADCVVAAPDIVLDYCDHELARAVWELNPMERSAILLHAIGNFKYREIAEILELPIGTVMSHLSRGRKHVRERLSEWTQKQNPARYEPESA